MTLTPKLRQASKSQQPYKLNEFPSGFADAVTREVFLNRATSLFSSDKVDIKGDEWEQIFANGINAKRDSAVSEGLDDIQDWNTSTAWGAKTVKCSQKSDIIPKISAGTAKLRLIIGRNSPIFSFDKALDPKSDDPQDIGGIVLEIWNQRVSNVRTKFRTVRTVVLVKCDSLKRVIVFEKNTELFDLGDYDWEWNSNGNLIGSFEGTGKFTWQPHGSQFTLMNVEIPSEALVIDIEEPSSFPRDELLSLTGWGKNKFSAYKISDVGS